MNVKEVIYGFLATVFINLLAVLTAGDGEILKGGFIFAVFVIFALCCYVRLMLASARKETYGEDAATDWASFGWFSLGAFIASGISLWVFLC